MNYPKTKREKVRLFDFSSGLDAKKNENLRPLSAKISFNFSLKDGSLRSGEGAEYFTVSGEPVALTASAPKKIYYYKRYDVLNGVDDDRLILYAADGSLYEKPLFSSGGFSRVGTLSFNSPPEGVCYKLNGDDVIMFSHGERLYVYDGTNVSDYAAPLITSMLVYNERLFVTTGGESTTLWFSENFDPTNWYVSLTEAGFIDFQDGKGKLLKMTESDGYAFVFRKYGITRIYAPFDQSEFTAVNVEADNVKIVGGVVDCGKKTIYLTDNGFCAFDGSYTSRVLTGIDALIRNVDNSGVKAAFFNGRYYAAIKISTDGKLVDVILSYDVSDGEYYFIEGVAARDITTVFAGEDNYLLLLLDGDNRVYKLSAISKAGDKILKKIYETPFTDFFIDGRKTLASVSLSSKKDATLIIKSDEGERRIRVFGSRGIIKQTVGLKGTSFSVRVESVLPEAEISKITLEFVKSV